MGNNTHYILVTKCVCLPSIDIIRNPFLDVIKFSDADDDDDNYDYLVVAKCNHLVVVHNSDPTVKSNIQTNSITYMIVKISISLQRASPKWGCCA